MAMWIRRGLIFVVLLALTPACAAPAPPYMCLPGLAQSSDGRTFQVLVCRPVPEAAVELVSP